MKILIYFIFTMTLFGCGNFFQDKMNKISSIQNEDLTMGQATIDFAEIKEKLFDPHCVKCHSNYSQFPSVKQNISGILNSIEQNRMPKNSPALDENLKLLLRIWVAEGANEKISDASMDLPSTEDPNTLKATWESLSLNIFEPKCLVCHSPSGKAPWINFSNRASMAKTLIKHIDFKNPEESNFILRLRDLEEPMPPLPPQSLIPQLTDEEILVVIDWINAGLP